MDLDEPMPIPDEIANQLPFTPTKRWQMWISRDGAQLPPIDDEPDQEHWVRVWPPVDDEREWMAAVTDSLKDHVQHG